MSLFPNQSNEQHLQAIEHAHRQLQEARNKHEEVQHLISELETERKENHFAQMIEKALDTLR